jgi:hypothetical protein
MMTDDYVRAILDVAARDASIARILREICALEVGVRSSALDLVGAHLRATSAGPDVLDCVQALRRDDVARAIIGHLGPPG